MPISPAPEGTMFNNPSTTSGLKERLQRGECCTGLFCSTPAALMVELIACAGYDFVVIDLEHTLIDGQQLEAMLLAARYRGISPWVRIAPDALYRVVQLLDAGAEGIVFARIRTQQQAQAAVQHCLYGSRGGRGLNSHRDNDYGAQDLCDYTHRANRKICTVLMIEDNEGLENLPQIAAVEGIDFLLPGAADLSQSMGIPWQTRHPKVEAAIERIWQICGQYGLGFCALPRQPADMQPWLERQVNCFILGDDRGISRRALQLHHQSYSQEKVEP